MARLKLDVHHFVACRAVPWEGLPGPHTARTLEGVCYRYGVPPGTEFPFEVEELWFYLRLYPRGHQFGTVPLFVRMIWNDVPGGTANGIEAVTCADPTPTGSIGDRNCVFGPTRFVPRSGLV